MNGMNMGVARMQTLEPCVSMHIINACELHEKNDM